MSTLQLSQQSVILPQKFPSRSGTSLKRTPRPERTKITQVYERSSTEIPTHRTSTSSKLDPIDDELLSLDLINQYNDIVGPKESLAFKRLPPVKVSYQTATKHKFVESPRVEGQSKIIRPHLSMKTYSPGHHIFTEGLSRSSIHRSPTFSLQQVGVPYSNLPDNISIYKEKDKFAFGVKDDECAKSPYRLTPTPLKLGNATLMTALESDQDKTKTHTVKSKHSSKLNPGRRSLEIKSNIIKLEPLVNKEEKDCKYDYKNKTEFNTDIVKIPSGYIRPSRSPLAPSNSFYQGESDVEVKTSTKSSDIGAGEKREERTTAKTETPKRKLSVVSIGETVGPSFYDSKKRETRQQYPMYDHTSKKNETLKRQKFEYNDNTFYHAKPHVPTATFTYKVSTHGLAFAQDNSADRFKPIKNNLYDRHGNVIHKQRGLGRYRPSDSHEDVPNNSSDYNFRRYYKRVFRRPKSSESQYTDFSQLPGNPPPSEISHIFSEDGQMLVNDVRNGMLTLVEERTMTAASLVSPLKDNTSVGEGKETNRTIKDTSEKPGSKLTNLEDTETCTDTDIQFEHALRTLERQQEQEIETARTTETDKKSEFETALSAAGKIKDTERIRSGNDNSSKGDGSVVEQYIAEAEERIKHFSIAEETEQQIVQVPNANPLAEISKGIKAVTFDESQTSKKKDQTKVKSGANKQYRHVPKLCLDSLDPSLQMSKERTSLSRSIQNMSLSDDKRRDISKLSSSIDLTEIQSGNENKRLPVTMLRLFSDASTLSNGTESVDLDLIEDTKDLYEAHANNLNDSKATKERIKEKKVLNNANMPFVYPSTSKGKAKRH
jgi:hypothetical protein